jgi:hypothetical protein
MKEGTTQSASTISATHGGSGSSPTKADSTARGASRAQPFPFPWQRERARILQRCCETILRAKERGRPADATIAQICRQRRDKTYKCDPRRKLQISEQTLRRLYYRWLRCGCSQSAFALRYTIGRRQISGKQRAIVRRHLLDARTVSLVAVHRSMSTDGQWTRSYDTLLRSLPKAWRKHLRAIFRARQAHYRVERSVARALQEGHRE